MANPADITIIGLGPGDPARRTVAAQAALDSAETIFIRGHEGVDLEDLRSRDNVRDLATFHDRSAGLASRWDSAIRAVTDAAIDGPVVVGIPGHPRFGEGLVVGILREAESRKLSIAVLDGVSIVDLLATGLDIDPLFAGLQLFNAREIAAEMGQGPFAGGAFTGTPHRPMLFTHVYSDEIRDGVAAALRRVFPIEHQVLRIESVGMGNEHISNHTIGELSNMPAGQLVALWVPAMDRLEAGRDPRTMQHIVARLRAPDGCLWDRKQSNQTLRDALIDEVYEAVDAIDAGDMENLAEELGDIFLLIAMHAQIAEEASQFTLEDVYEGIATKIVRRHPHVFGDRAAHDAEDVVGIWHKVKADERANGKKPTKALDGQPHAMPALERAKRVLKKRPLDGESREAADPSGEQLLEVIAGIIDAGDDPDTVLRAALERHVGAADRDNS